MRLRQRRPWRRHERGTCQYRAEHIGDHVVLANDPGRGLRIVIHVPLTLSILSTIVMGVGSQCFALPRQAIEEIVMVRGDQVRLDTIGDAATATVRGRRMPLVSLATLFSLGPTAPPTLIIVSTPEHDYALGVDTVLDTEELVVKPASPAVMAAGVYAGMTLPDNGLPTLLLDASGIAAIASLQFAPIAAIDASIAEAAVPCVRVLLFDDLDGHSRAIALAVIDRIESVSNDAIRWSAGAMSLTVGKAIIPLYAVGDLGTRLRLTDEDSKMAYAIAEAIEIVELPADIAPPRGLGVDRGRTDRVN
jgi:two-component system chemotaxis sensor kinase CheA